MGKQLKLSTSGNKSFRLLKMADYLEELKDALADIIEEYEAEDAGEEELDSLTEALDALEDACEAIHDVC